MKPRETEDGDPAAVRLGLAGHDVIVVAVVRTVIRILGVCLLISPLGSSCGWQNQSECHGDMLERFGCCPTCDAECRAAIDEACTEFHEPSLRDLEDDEGESDDSDEMSDEPDDESVPAPE